MTSTVSSTTAAALDVAVLDAAGLRPGALGVDDAGALWLVSAGRRD